MREARYPLQRPRPGLPGSAGAAAESAEAWGGEDQAEVLELQPAGGQSLATSALPERTTPMIGLSTGYHYFDKNRTFSLCVYRRDQGLDNPLFYMLRKKC